MESLEEIKKDEYQPLPAQVMLEFHDSGQDVVMQREGVYPFNNQLKISESHIPESKPAQGEVGA